MTKRKDLNNFSVAYSEGSDYDVESLLSIDWYSDRVVELSPAGDMLELGVGHGATINKFSNIYRRHVIIEGSEDVIRSFREKYGNYNVEIVHSLFEEYESRELFDVIVMGFILEHVDNPSLILKRFWKFLKPSGYLYVAVPNACSLHRRIGFEAGMLDDVYKLSDYDRKLGHKRFYDLSEIECLIKESGYDIRLVEGILLKPFTSVQINSLGLSAEAMQGLLKIGMKYPELSNSLLIQAQKE